MNSAAGLLTSVTSWTELQSRIETLSTEKQKGDCFELLVRYYLTLEPKYATKLRQVWLLREVPPEIASALALPDSDEGIDLVAETKDGRYWAIQAKYRGPADASLTRPELATFTDLAFTICRNFDLALVCTTADRFSHKLEMYGTRVTLCTGDAWRRLDSEFFKRLSLSLHGSFAPLVPYVPRPHQASAIASARRHFVDQSATRGKLIMPCGTGKSLAGFWIARELGATRILVAVPSLALIRQTLLVWARECLAHDIDVHWIAVCSDPTVGDPEADDPILLTQDFGVDVTTDSATVAEWLTRDADFKVVFCTYQSGRVLSQAARASGCEFDLGILDEAHRTVGKRESLFSHLLFDDNVSIRRRVFMTATERLYAGGSANRVIGMGDQATYGTVFESLSFRAALDATPPILSDYRIVTLVVTREEIDSLIARNAFVRPTDGNWNGEIEAQQLSAVVALRKAMREFPISHALSFHGSIAKARIFAENQGVFTAACPEFGELAAYHVSGNTKTATRDERMREFAQSSRALMTNARCLTEGVDVPDIDCVLFADPKRSTVDIVQAVGRALRPSPDGGLAYILIPVEVERIDDVAALQEAVFGSTLIVLRALAANDERIVEYFRTVASGKPWAGPQIPFEIKLPVGVAVDIDAFVHGIELECWSRLGKLSWRPFEEARTFVRELGLKSTKDWSEYCYPGIAGKPKRPPDIPTAPQQVYRGRGWTSYGDWLGLEARNGPGRRGMWRPFPEAREWARTLKLGGSTQWMDYVTGRVPHDISKPNDIPASPSQSYKNCGWLGWGDFLGTGNVAGFERNMRPFRVARRFARSLGLKTRDEWHAYARGKRSDLPPFPNDIPVRPEVTYANKGWAGVGDWLGTGAVRTSERKFLPFEEARSFVRSLGLKTTLEWADYCAGRSNKGKRPPNVPATPAKTYQGKGWSGMSDWLGTGRARMRPRRKQSWRKFEDARSFARTLGLRDGAQWEAYCRGAMPHLPPRPIDIPHNPRQVYAAEGWQGYRDWVGRVTPSFEEARAFARTLKLRGSLEWLAYMQGKMPHLGECPKQYVHKPDQRYRDSGWKGWADFLGTDIPWQPFAQAREFARSLKLKGRRDWLLYRRGQIPNVPPAPADIPATPNVIYKLDGWISWEDWLGCEPLRRGRKQRRSASAVATR